MRRGSCSIALTCWAIRISITDNRLIGTSTWFIAGSQQPIMVADSLVSDHIRALGLSHSAAEKLKAEHGIDCEVVDVRSLVPLDTQTILGSVAKTHRLFTVEENPRLCGWGAEIVSIVAEEAFGALTGPVGRITPPHIPLPAADRLEDHVLPSVDRIVETVSKAL